MAFKLLNRLIQTAEKLNKKQISLRIKHRQDSINFRFKMRIVIFIFIKFQMVKKKRNSLIKDLRPALIY